MVKIIRETGKHDQLRDKFIAGNTVYMENSFEDIAIKAVPLENSSQYFAKFKGRKEYEIKGSSQVVIEAWFEAREITEQEYKNY